MAGDRKQTHKRATTHGLPRVPEYVDPESDLTPPPIHVEELRGFDTIPPPIQDQLRMLADGIEHVRARSRDSERLDRIETKQDIASQEIAELGALIREFLMPAVKASQSRIDILLSHHEASRVRVEMFYDREWPAAVKALEGMTERLQRVERQQERQADEMKGMSDRLNANHGALAGRVAQVETFESRIAQLERDKRDAHVVGAALTLRSKALYGFAVTAIGALSGLLGSLVN